jgi:putative transposase
MEMVVNSVSIRKVTQITKELCDISKSTVSELCKRLDPVVTAWNNRSLRDSRYPFVIVDALVLKVREEGRVHARGVMLAYGVNAEHVCLIGALFMEIDEKWASGKKYHDMTEYLAWQQTQVHPPSRLISYLSPFCSKLI